jgi:hypothetical protein
MILLATACGPVRVAGSASPASAGPATSATPATPASSEASATAPPSPAEPASGAETPEAAVERWVTQILEERYIEACLSGAPLLPAGQDAEALCQSPAALSSAKSLREAWAKPGVDLPPQAKVAVATVPATGDKVTVPDTAVEVGGRTLRELELIGATGDTGSFSLSLKVQKHAGAWYVTGFDLKA